MKAGENRSSVLWADAQNARRVNAENLRAILADNRDTAFGREHGFAAIADADAFRAAVPLSDYDSYGDALREAGRFSAYPVHRVLSTSGTTGHQKYFPISAESLRRDSTYVLDVPNAAAEITGPLLHTNMFRAPVDGVSILSNVYFRYIREAGVYDFGVFVGGEAAMFADEPGDVTYIKAWLALATPALQGFQSIFLYDLALFFSYIEREWRRILSDMERGEVSAAVSDEMRALLLSHRPDAAWLSRARAVLEEGFDTPIVPRLWRDVRFAGGIGGKMYRFQEKALVRYIGDLPLHYSIYASSECMMGIAPGLSKVLSRAEYMLLPRSAFYEFLPKDAPDSPVALEDLAIGGEYEPVVTTFSGLYRYKTGDLVRVSSFCGEAPVFEVVGRRRLLINIAGEKIDVYTMTEAIDRFAKAKGLPVADFAVGVDHDSMPNGYHVFIEADGDAPIGGAEDFDAILRGLSPDYDDVRSLGQIALPKLYAVRRGEIFRSIAAGAKAAHNKPRVFINDAATAYLLGGLADEK